MTPDQGKHLSHPPLRFTILTCVSKPRSDISVSSFRAFITISFSLQAFSFLWKGLLFSSHSFSFRRLFLCRGCLLLGSRFFLWWRSCLFGSCLFLGSWAGLFLGGGFLFGSCLPLLFSVRFTCRFPPETILKFLVRTFPFLVGLGGIFEVSLEIRVDCYFFVIGRVKIFGATCALLWGEEFTFYGQLKWSGPLMFDV